MKQILLKAAILEATCYAVLFTSIARPHAERGAEPAVRADCVAPVAAAATKQTESAVPRKEPSGVLTLPEALALALTENPELAPFAWQERANEARILQAGRRLNPELSLEVEDVLGTGIFSGGNQAQTTLQLSQAIELGGKRAGRTAVASQARGVTQSEYELRRVDVLADVTLRFIQVVAAQHALDLAVTSRRLAEDALQSVQTRVEAGRGSSLEERKAQVALARGLVLVETAEHELSAARKMLTSSWQNTEPVFERAEADLFARDPVPPMEELVGRISSSPEIARWVSEQKLREAEIKLADARRLPNLTLGGGIRRLEGFDAEAFVFSLSVPLQLFDRNQGAKAEARALLDLTRAEREAAEFRLGVVLLGLYEEMVHDIHVMDGLEKEILPKAEDALAIAREGYVQGRFSYLEVLDAQRTIFDVRHEYIRTATSYHQFIVEIERLTGLPLDGGEPHK